MMSEYAYIGKYWYNPGSWSLEGCKYFSYIKSYMSSSRSNTVSAVISKSISCSASGVVCIPSTSEDQNTYATCQACQVQEKMGPTINNVFGV